ncbi:hypothetical protein NC651_034622 [Populus alba x Populus x berolinensis]|nr:hypothetical protein NC651_034622 [Populus alba x Populus x berolinensis]
MAQAVSLAGEQRTCKELGISGKESNNMGCISSKLVSRSLSFQEELTKNMQRSANDIPALEELALSGNINDQFFALVCTANTVACTYKSGSFSGKSNNPVVEPDINLTKNQIGI